MQYQQFIEKVSKRRCSAPTLSIFIRISQGILFSPESYRSPLPPVDPAYPSKSEPRIPNKRERYRATRLVAEISSSESCRAGSTLKRYILHKFRNNRKRNTIRGALTSAVKFLNVHSKATATRDLETMRTL